MKIYSAQIRSSVQNLQFGGRSVPLAILLLCLLAYGLLLHTLGFYWDDWPWIWISHVDGPAGMLKIDQAYRPLSGVILWGGAMLAGKTPLSWQILNLLFRWLTGLALWWSLRKLWPKHLEKSIWVVFIFLVYPGFTQQFVSVNSSRHILPLATFFLSIGFMIWAIQEKDRFWLYTVISLLLSAFTLLGTDYYYGLELVRPVIIWLALKQREDTAASQIKSTLKFWFPYLILFAVLIIWRYWSSDQSMYPVQIASNFKDAPLPALTDTLRAGIGHIYNSSLLAWTNVFAFPAGDDVRLRRLLLYWAVMALTFISVVFYLFKLREDETSDRIWDQAILLGFFSLLTGSLPFLVAGIEMGLNFPVDRTTLPMMFGASLVFVGFVDLLARARLIKIFIISLAVGLAVGSQMLTAVSFENDWIIQESFFRQLAWRAPGLEQNTAIVYEHTPALGDSRVSDNSLTAPLNWIYAPDVSGSTIPYYIYDLRLRSYIVLPALENDQSLNSDYGEFSFTGSPENMLLVQFAPPWCLQVLQPPFEGLYPHLPDNLAHSVNYSNPGVIDPDPISPGRLPIEIFPSEPEPGWCYYFQQADAARQRGDWKTVAEIGDLAFTLIDQPKQPSERIPFIQAYGYIGRWDRAEELTHETSRRDKNAQPMLCLVWAELEVDTPDTVEKNSTIQRVMAKLNCSENE